MTDQTPIERAGRALQDARRASTDLLTSTEKARAVFGSIDVDQLANIIREIECEEGWMIPFVGIHHLAPAIKNWLTGKDQQ